VAAGEPLLPPVRLEPEPEALNEGLLKYEELYEQVELRE
jgi:hypothetical protein